MHDQKIRPSKLDIILEKKQNLDATIQACEIRIDEKLASLIEDGIISKEINPDLFETHFQDLNQSGDHFLSGVDISDDDALDQAVLHSRPLENKGNQLAFDGDTLLDKTSKINNLSDLNTLTAEEDDDEELPTLSKILGRTTSFTDDQDEEEPPELNASWKTGISEEPPELNESQKPEISEAVQTTYHEFFRDSEMPDAIETPASPLNQEKSNETAVKPGLTTSIKLEDIKTSAPDESGMPNGDTNLPLTEIPAKKNKKHDKKNKQQEKTLSVQKPSLVNMILPLVFFIFGLGAFGAFLILSAQAFNFVDYTVLFIFFTCLIFTIAIPYSASIFFMILLLCSYVALSLISIFYLEIPFELYQTGWIIVIPLLLWSSALLIKKVRELFAFKKALERQIASYDALEESPGLTIEKAYYKDLKYAMERAAKGETTLSLEMISISHLETLKSINGSRLWDEILYKTLKIIKMNCYNHHLIYILEGSIFSILMENTSTKDQLLINQRINEAFSALISQYDAIDAQVELKIATVPYSRNLTNPFDYRALGLRHLSG